MEHEIRDLSDNIEHEIRDLTVLKLSGADATTHADEWLGGKITYKWKHDEKDGKAIIVRDGIESRERCKKAFVFGFGIIFTCQD